MSVPKIDDVADPVIGKVYLVPTVFNRAWGFNVPIYGPAHTDKEFLDFEPTHWHVDWRFACLGLYKSKLRTRNTSTGNPSSFLHGIVTCVENGSIIVQKRLHMKRATPIYPPAHKVPWLKKLEDAFTFHRLPRCRTCPHKGISLKHVKSDEQGLITCPGHGLTWHSKTGALIRAT